MGQCSGEASAHLPVCILAIPSLPHAPARLSATVRETLLWVQFWAYPESFHVLTGLSPTDITQQQCRQVPPGACTWQRGHVMESLEPRCCCCRTGTATAPWEGDAPPLARAGQSEHRKPQTLLLSMALGQVHAREEKHFIPLSHVC